MNSSKLLIKFPTRSRPEKFFNVLAIYYQLLQGSNYEFVVSCDIDDPSMNNDEIKHRLNQFPNLTAHFNDNASKIQAVNADMKGKKFDILLLASDDMIPEYNGYDDAIRKAFSMAFPDFDGVVWFDDGFQSTNLNTLAIIGSKYYERFNYIYHPAYKSLYCDAEFTHVSKQLHRVVYVDKCIIRHRQYSIIKDEPDALYIRNDSIQHEDRQTFELRLNRNFDL